MPDRSEEIETDDGPSDVAGTPGDGADVDEQRDQDRADGADTPPDLGRRRLLAASGAAATGAIAGCGGGDGDGSDPSTTAGEASTTAEPTSTATTTTAPTSTAEPTTTTPTATTTTPELTDASQLVNSPSSDIQPLDGFANADWLLGEEPQIITVTNRAPYGEGSLKAALETQGPRIIVFEVGGVWNLGGDTTLQTRPREITVGDYDFSRCFIAGQTAPPPGVTLIRGEFSPYARNTILQHIRVRVGDNVGDAYDSISIGSVAANCIVDHCTASWSVDENLSADGGADVPGKTITNNLIAEGLYDSVHSKGPHSMGSLIEENQDGLTVAGNVYSHHDQRHPRLKGGVQGVVVNNVAHNFGVAIGMGGEGEVPARASVVGNHWIAGPDTNDSRAIVFNMYNDETEAYLEDNITEPSSLEMIDNIVVELDERAEWPEGLEAMPSGEVLEHNLATAGARPAQRTPHDERVVRDVREGNGALIDSQQEVGGYPALSATRRSLDPPEWGPAFAEWLTQHNRAVELGESPPD